MNRYSIIIARNKYDKNDLTGLSQNSMVRWNEIIYP